LCALDYSLQPVFYDHFEIHGMLPQRMGHPKTFYPGLVLLPGLFLEAWLGTMLLHCQQHATRQI
jgi:hypothetical protein